MTITKVTHLYDDKNYIMTQNFRILHSVGCYNAKVCIVKFLV